MAITPAELRSHFPEFANTVTYPDSQVQFWLDFAYQMLNTGRWMSQIDMGAQLYVCHNLALEARAQATAAAGGIPGSDVGVLNSKSVDSVSAGYDTGATTIPGAGDWNATIYGIRFYKLLRIFGSGPLQIGGGCIPPYSGPAWPGPDCSPGFTTFG